MHKTSNHRFGAALQSRRISDNATTRRHSLGACKPVFEAPPSSVPSLSLFPLPRFLNSLSAPVPPVFSAFLSYVPLRTSLTTGPDGDTETDTHRQARPSRRRVAPPMRPPQKATPVQHPRRAPIVARRAFAPCSEEGRGGGGRRKKGNE